MTYNPAIEIHRRTLAIALIDHLESAGFDRCERLEGAYGDLSEVVYAKHVNGRHIVAVYTSCNQRTGAWEARNSGKDAIRVAALYMPEDGQVRGLSRFKRINRTGRITAIIARVLQRVEEATQVSQHPHICEKCGGSKFLAKSGNYCCVAFCWK